MTAPTLQFSGGTPAGGTATTLSLTGTAEAGDLVYVAFIVYEVVSITGVTCDGVAAMTNRPTSPVNPGFHIWWGVFDGTTANPTVTVDFGASVANIVIASVWRGAAAPVPFDPNAALNPPPLAQTPSASSQSISYTTTSADDALLFIGSCNNSATLTPPAGWTAIYNNDIVGEMTFLMAYLTPGVAESGLVATMNSTGGSVPYPSAIADALTAGTGASLNATFADITLAGAATPVAGASLNATFADITLAGAATPVSLAPAAGAPAGPVRSGDFATILSPDLVFDWAIADGDLADDGGLNTAVAISLFTDRLANPDDVLPDNSGDRRGWGGDEFLPPLADGVPDHIGSRLWLLHRAKQLPETAQLAQAYCEEALQWLIDDGVAGDVSVPLPTFPLPGMMQIEVAISRQGPTGAPVLTRYAALWDIALGQVASFGVALGGL